MKKIKAFLLRDKRGKMRRAIYFNRHQAFIHFVDYQEIVPCEITLEIISQTKGV